METPVAQPKIMVLLESQVREYQFADFGLTPDTDLRQIAEAISPVILEAAGFDLMRALDSNEYIAKQSTSSQDVSFFPKSTAG